MVLATIPCPTIKSCYFNHFYAPFSTLAAPFSDSYRRSGSLLVRRRESAFNNIIRTRFIDWSAVRNGVH